MKKLIALFAAIVLVSSLTSTVKAQGVSANATGSATIVTTLAIAKSADMNFGSIAVNATAGTVVLVPAGTRTATGGVTLQGTGTGVAAAAFNVTGLINATYTITLPTTAYTITRQSGTETMSITGFNSTPTSTGTLSSGGTQTVSVGATLNVTGGQIPGLYTATGFPVTVNYN
jgi:hypothetical protein